MLFGRAQRQDHRRRPGGDGAFDLEPGHFGEQAASCAADPGSRGRRRKVMIASAISSGGPSTSCAALRVTPADMIWLMRSCGGRSLSGMKIVRGRGRGGVTACTVEAGNRRSSGDRPRSGRSRTGIVARRDLHQPRQAGVAQAQVFGGDGEHRRHSHFAFRPATAGEAALKADPGRLDFQMGDVGNHRPVEVLAQQRRKSCPNRAPDSAIRTTPDRASLPCAGRRRASSR